MSRPADGLCAIEIIAKNIALADSSTITHFRRWSRNMINTCQADQNEVKGGIATSMGASGNLGLILTKFNPELIVCRGPKTPILADCEVLLNSMPVADVWQKFGNSGDPGVQIQLPYVIEELDRRCKITVYSTGAPDEEKWYAVWKHAVAIARLCVSEESKPGSTYGLGEISDPSATVLA
ncbi:hypothetical protein MMC28_010073 [Mycoblastus sanguinarius]|nr:hypothetical protein [Mycoblastus sanguinarius]